MSFILVLHAGCHNAEPACPELHLGGACRCSIVHSTIVVTRRQLRISFVNVFATVCLEKNSKPHYIAWTFCLCWKRHSSNTGPDRPQHRRHWMHCCASWGCGLSDRLWELLCSTLYSCAVFLFLFLSSCLYDLLFTLPHYPSTRRPAGLHTGLLPCLSLSFSLTPPFTSETLVYCNKWQFSLMSLRKRNSTDILRSSQNSFTFSSCLNACSALEGRAKNILW